MDDHDLISAKYIHSWLEMRAPFHPAFVAEVLKTVPFRSVGYLSGYEANSPGTPFGIHIEGGYHQAAEIVFVKWFPFAQIISGGYRA